MHPLTEPEIRAAFVNCTKGETKRLNVPRNLSELPWEDLDFLGWRDPGAPDRGCLVAEHHGTLTGVVLRVPQGVRHSLTRTNVCSVCITPHAGSGVALLAAPKAGPAGRQGNTVGTYVCADLACPLYVRGLKRTELGSRYEESLSEDERIARMLGNLGAFLDQVLGARV